MAFHLEAQQPAQEAELGDERALATLKQRAAEAKNAEQMKTLIQMPFFDQLPEDVGVANLREYGRRFALLMEKKDGDRTVEEQAFALLTEGATVDQVLAYMRQKWDGAEG